ncbi:MAG: TPM domain-containing protein [Vulcanimicrobiota bacterium]
MLKKNLKYLLLISIIIIFTFQGCSKSGNEAQPYDANTSVPAGNPDFPPLSDSWVIDKTGVLEPETISKCSQICQELQNDGIAEMVVVIINGVNDPEKWATHYGRWLKLGKKGPSSQGGNNGIVWLIRPDARGRVTISVGRGLPRFATADFTAIIDEAIEYINFDNFDKGVIKIVTLTDKRLRELEKE